MKSGCDYYKSSFNDTANCPNGVHWLPEGERCCIEDKVRWNDKPSLANEPVLLPDREVRRVMRKAFARLTRFADAQNTGLPRKRAGTSRGGRQPT